jgi:hypothetical protein
MAFGRRNIRDYVTISVVEIRSPSLQSIGSWLDEQGWMLKRVIEQSTLYLKR